MRIEDRSASPALIQVGIAFKIQFNTDLTVQRHNQVQEMEESGSEGPLSRPPPPQNLMVPL